MLFLIFTPFVLLAMAMFVDEFYFHHKRGLPKWERLGHPVDTLTVIAVYLFALFSTFSETNVVLFVLGSLFSTLFVTKDEFIHSEKCDSKEIWLHAVLFGLHPLQFVSAAFIWAQRDGVISFLPIDVTLSKTFLISQTALLIVFFLYQLLYWNILWPKKSLSTTTSTNV